MTKKDAIKIFEDKKIRAVWDDKKEDCKRTHTKGEKL